MKKITEMLARLARDEQGASAVEYGVIAALVIVVAIAAFTTLGLNLTSVITRIATTLTGG